jgi:hypothetical protein
MILIQRRYKGLCQMEKWYFNMDEIKTVGKSPEVRRELRLQRIKREKEEGIERLPFEKLKALPLDQRKVADSLYMTIGSDVKQRYFRAVGELHILHKQIEDRRMMEMKACNKVNVAYRDKNRSVTLKTMLNDAIELGRTVATLRKSYYQTKVI